MATDKPRLSITFDEDTLERIEQFQRKHNFATKSKAIQVLVEAGLREYKIKAPDSKEPKAEDRFMKAYSRLSPERKDFLLAVVKALVQQD